MATMQDIADRVGVHRVTVSNVLNGRLSMQRPDAARRAAEIRRVAVEMGYRPSSAALAVRKGSSGLIGMIRSPHFHLSVHSPAFECGIEQALHERGLCLVRDIIDESDNQENQLPRIVRETLVDGLIINYAFGLPEHVKQSLDRCEEPAVWVNRKREYNSVRPADREAAAEATRHLLRQGHRRVLYVEFDRHACSGRFQPHYSLEDRYLGYATAMLDAGLEPRREVFGNDQPYPQRTGWRVRQFTEFMRGEDRPTAVLSSDGGRYLRLAACELGLSVPADLSLMTFDHEAGDDHWIGVDRLLVPYQAMGTAAVGMLGRLIETPDRLPPIVLPFEFHTTGTVAPPPGVPT